MSSFNWPAGGGGAGVTIYPTFAAFQNGSEAGDLAVAADTGNLYEWTGSAWQQIAGPGAALTLTAFGSSPNDNGLTLSGGVLNMQPADATHPGGVSTTTQTIAGDKTIQGVLTLTQPAASGNVSMLVFGNNVDTTPAIQWTSDNAQNGLLFYRDSTSNLEAQLTHTGVWKSHGVQDLGGAYLLNNLGQLRIIHDNSVPDQVQATIKAAASQAAHITDWLDSNNNVLASIDALGNIAGANLSGTNTGDMTLGTANGLSVTGQALSLALSSTSTTGALSNTDWNTFNSKQSALTLGNLTDAGTDGITVTGGTGAVVGSGTSISQHVADTSHNGYLSSADWNTFNGKQAALTLTNLTDAGTDGITITNGTGAVIGASPVTIAQHVADTTHNGYLSSTDWNTFNGKQATGNYITALTSDVTASGPGSVAATIAAGAVTLAKMANLADMKVIGRDAGSTGVPLALTLASANTASSVVYRDSSGNFSAGTITAALTGNASTATSATTATNIAGGAGGSIPYQSAAATTAMLANGSAGQYLKSTGGTSAPAWTTFTQPTQQILISGTTYTTPAGCKAIRIRLVGGGGGGGGAATAGGAAGAAGGGGGGGYVEHFITSPAANYTYAIGAGGAQGSAGNNAGSSGGDTTFGGILTGSAGGGGAGSGAAASPVAKAGGDGGLATGGNILNIPGGQGSPGLICSATEATAGNGGATPFGMPAKGYTGVSHAGVAGNTNGGGGGSGGIQVNNGGNVTGGNGAAGQIIVDEYYE